MAENDDLPLPTRGGEMVWRNEQTARLRAALAEVIADRDRLREALTTIANTFTVQSIGRHVVSYPQAVPAAIRRVASAALSATTEGAEHG